MKKKLVPILFLIAIFAKTDAQGLLKTWQKTYGGSYPDFLVTITSNLNNNLLLWGYAASFDGDLPAAAKSFDIWKLEVNEDGEIINSNIYGETADDKFYSVEESNDNGFITASMNLDKGDIDLYKIGEDNMVKWVKSYGGSKNEYPSKIIRTKDNNYLVIGRTYSNDGDVKVNYGYEDIWLLKIDQSGDTIWTKSIGGSGWDQCIDAICLDDSSFILVGTSDSKDGDFKHNYGGSDMFIMKLKNNGIPEWIKSYGGSLDDYGNSIITSDSGYMVVGRSSSNDYDVEENKGGADGWITNFNANGDLIWSYTYGGKGEEDLSNINKYKSHQYLVGGYSSSTDGDVKGLHGKTDQWLQIIDEFGNLLWSECYGGSNIDEITSLIEMNDNYYVFGHSNSTDGDILVNKGWEDLCLYKFKPLLNINISASSNFICKGDVVSFTANVNANLDSVKYHWLKDSVFLDNENDSILTINKIESTSSGFYYCVIESLTSTDTSNKISLSFGKYFVYSSLSICQSDSLYVGGGYQRNVGIYSDTIHSANSCDSIIISSLSIYPNFESTILKSFCNGDSLLISDKYIKSTGVYFDSLLTINGCDSVLIYNIVFSSYASLTNGIANNIDIYPNPVKDNLIIDIKKLKYYEFYNASGILLLKSNSPIIDVRNYKEGLYFIKIIDANNILTFRKVIVIK